ncbi:MAG: ribonuclease Y [Eubacteriales bacterium]|nr:ribonuclease Y [Eubacteriales bacterium]
MYLYMLAGLVLGAILASALVYHYFTKGYSKASKELAENTARSLQEIEERKVEALKAGESRKRELLLETKEEVHKAKIDLDQAVREKRLELQKERQRLEQKEENLSRKAQANEDREKHLNNKDKQLKEREDALSNIEFEKQQELERLAGLSLNEARDILLNEARETYTRDFAILLKNLEAEAREKADLTAKELIVTSIQRYASDYVSDATVSVVNLPNEEMKGRIIGREGRNIRTIESLTGVDLIIDDTPEAVILSCFDPIRREIARIAIEKLVFDGRIHPTRIEEMVEKARKEIAVTIREAGEQAVFETGVMALHPELVKILGRMKFRTSYGQNALQHSIEVAKITGMLASELGLDVNLAKRAGLLHDIGKAIDFELEGSHVELGSQIARKYREPEVVVNAIESHHGDVEATSMLSKLVAAADAISAARPGARRENIETYIKRIEKLEEIASSFPGVEKVFAVQAGREVRVLVRPEEVKDEDLIIKAHEISKRIEEELTYPGQIKVQMIREFRASEYAK